MSRSSRQGSSRASTVRKIVAGLRAQGWRVDQRGHTWRCFPPDKGMPPVFLAPTPTDHRAIENMMRELRHSGADISKLPKD